MKLCWCCNGKGFYMKPDCELCDRGIDHYQCLNKGEPKKRQCHVCDKKLKPREELKK